MTPMTLGQIAAAMGASVPDDATGRILVQRVTTDSRRAQPGDLFWALAGERFDGHDFVPAAMAAGAVAAVVSDEYVGREPTLGVADTRQALGDFAGWYRRDFDAAVIGVTGSVGKTTTRQAIHAVLAVAARGLASAKNQNNELGVPLSLLELGPEHEYAVIEMGASGPGEIARLCDTAAPDIGVLTAIGEAHLEGFGDLDGVMHAKAELVAALGTSGTAVLNADDPRVRAIGERAVCRVAWYGVQQDGPEKLAAACDIECHEHGIRFTLVDGPRVTMPAHGRHQVYAALAAAAVARLRGMPDEQIVRGLSQMQAAPMRCEVHRIGAVTLINDAYNANPLSMQAAAAMLAEWPARGRRILVCGDMLELGAAGVDRHRRLGDSVARRGVIGHLIAVGPLSRWTAEAAVAAGMPARDVKHCMTADHAVVELSRLVGAGDVIVVKASRGLRLERVAEAVLRACGSLPAAA